MNTSISAGAASARTQTGQFGEQHRAEGTAFTQPGVAARWQSEPPEERSCQGRAGQAQVPGRWVTRAFYNPLTLASPASKRRRLPASVSACLPQGRTDSAP